jgi:D-psicose/D-tagatose/L-ribulose 3-epimerase
MNLNRVSVLTAFLFLTLKVSADNAAPKVPPPVPGFPIGRCVQVIGVTTPEEAKQAGFEYLELALPALLPLSDGEFEKQAARLRGIGLPMLSGYGFIPSDLRIVGTNVDIVQVDKAVRHGLARAKQLGLKMVICGNLLGGTRRVPEGFPRDTAHAQFLDFARRAAAEGKKHDITVLIQPMPKESTDLINTVAEGLKFVQEVNDPNLQLLVDYTSFVQNKEDLAVLKKAAPHIRQVEIQNPNGRIYPVSADESDYASFFHALKQGGYRGGFSIHGKPGDVFVNGPKAITLLRTLAAGK